MSHARRAMTPASLDTNDGRNDQTLCRARVIQAIGHATLVETYLANCERKPACADRWLRSVRWLVDMSRALDTDEAVYANVEDVREPEWHITMAAVVLVRATIAQRAPLTPGVAERCRSLFEQGRELVRAWPKEKLSKKQLPLFGAASPLRQNTAER